MMMRATSADLRLPPVHSVLGRNLQDTVAAAAVAAAIPSGPFDTEAVTEDDLAGLPATAQRYFRFMGVLGRARDWSFSAEFKGRFRVRPGQGWMPFEMWQFNSAVEVARIAHMRVDFAGLVPMVGQDTYVGGRGHMNGRLVGLVTVADGTGAEFDVGELSTWLNDAVLLAPSMLLDWRTTFSAVDEFSFDVTTTDAAHTVTARVLVDGRGAPIDFTTTDRWCALPSGLVRARWNTPIDGWETDDGLPMPTRGSATWTLPNGPFTYLEGRFVPGSVRRNVGVQDLRRGRDEARNNVHVQ